MQGVLTHGHLPENDNHGGTPTRPAATPTHAADGAAAPATVPIAGLRLRRRRPAPAARPRSRPSRRASRSTFDNLDAQAPDGIWHTITACKAPCNRSTGIAYPLADGDVDVRLGRARATGRRPTARQPHRPGRRRPTSPPAPTRTSAASTRSCAARSGSSRNEARRRSRRSPRVRSSRAPAHGARGGADGLPARSEGAAERAAAGITVRIDRADPGLGTTSVAFALVRRRDTARAVARNDRRSRRSRLVPDRPAPRPRSSRTFAPLMDRRDLACSRSARHRALGPDRLQIELTDVALGFAARADERRHRRVRAASSGRGSGRMATRPSPTTWTPSALRSGSSACSWICSAPRTAPT